MINIYIGFDAREAAAFNVLAYSIHRRASAAVSVTPIMLSQLKGIFCRERHPLQSTDFSFSRFLTPHLSDYNGWSLFMDCDMLMLDDVAKLWALRDERYAAMVIKHEHVPKEERKFLNEPQTKYEKKNWSSVMLFNNARCRRGNAHPIRTARRRSGHRPVFFAFEADARGTRVQRVNVGTAKAGSRIRLADKTVFPIQQAVVQQAVDLHGAALRGRRRGNQRAGNSYCHQFCSFVKSPGKFMLRVAVL